MTQKVGWFRLIVAGGRNFSDYELVKKHLDLLLIYQHDVEIVSGRCDRGVHTFTTDDGIKVFGADGLGERYAKENNHAVKPFPADWKRYGLSAGPRRNEQMGEYADALVAFWDDKSAGTRNMIDSARELGLNIRVIHY